MQRPVEIYRKKTSLLWLTALGLGGAAFLTWANYDELTPLSWETAYHSAGIIIAGFAGLSALLSLIISVCSHDPYLLVYEECIEMPRLLSRNCRVVHFCDVKDVKEEGDGRKTKILFYMQPYLKKSDLPRGTKLLKKFLGADFAIPLSSLEMPSDEAYNLILDRYLKYHHQDRKEKEETDDEVLDKYLSRLKRRPSIGFLKL